MSNENGGSSLFIFSPNLRAHICALFPRFSLCFPCPIVYNKLNLIDSIEERRYDTWHL